jgi:signal transduction histidine kinase/CheY-like chemotaxis protein
MDINSYNNNLKEYYDRAYSRYLQKTPARILLTALLSDIVNLIGGGKGAIIEPDTRNVIASVLDSEYNSIDSTNLDTNEWVRSALTTSDHTRTEIVNSIKTSFDTGDISSIISNNNVIISIPFKLSNKVNGQMTLVCLESVSNDQLRDAFFPFQSMMGVLFYMIKDTIGFESTSLPEGRRSIFSKSNNSIDHNTLKCQDGHAESSDNESLDSISPVSPSAVSPSSPYIVDSRFNQQIMIDAVNSVCDSIIITDRDLKIIFKNDPAHRLLKSYFKDSYRSDNIVDIIPQTISFMSTCDNDSYYRNKKIHVDMASTYCGRLSTCELSCKSHDDNKVEICANSICSSGSLYHVMRLTIKTREKKDSGKGKNLVAYLSHELRNPIQAITTGVYVINRTLQSICGTTSISPIFSSFDSHDYSSNDTDHTSSDSVDDHIAKEILDLSDIDSMDGTAKITSSKKYKKTGDRTIDDKNIGALRAVMKRVDSSCKNMKIIIDDILDLSKLDNDEMIMNMDQYDIEEIIQVIADEYTPIAASKGLDLVCTIESDVPDRLYTDETRVYQVLSNLISNSIKYSNGGTIILATCYDPELNSVCFEIKDTGKGIRKSEMNNLFKDFGITTNSIPGINSNGLGLCVCQKIADLLGGSIEVRSEYRKGSTFTFVHPINLTHSSSTESTDLTDSEIQDNILCYVKGDILIVDDDENITALFKLLLKLINYDHGAELKIDTAKNEERTVSLTNRKAYDLIFMDIDLDGEDGCSICDTICSGDKNIDTPIIAITANIKTIQKDRDPKYDCFKDILLKPFTNKDINRIIARYISI